MNIHKISISGRVSCFTIIGPANLKTVKVQLFLGHQRRILVSCVTVKRSFVVVESVCLQCGFNKMAELSMQQMFCEECFHSMAGSRGGDGVQFHPWSFISGGYFRSKVLMFQSRTIEELRQGVREETIAILIDVTHRIGWWTVFGKDWRYVWATSRRRAS